VRFNPGPDGPEAARLLKTLETSYTIPLPFGELAVVCVEGGYEEEWTDRIEANEWVEFVRRQSVNPLICCADEAED
jgi:hypothetical protein